MRWMSIAAVAALLLSAPAAAAAQSVAPGEVVGQVLDETTHRPVPSAAVTVYGAADSAVAGRVLTGRDGAFVVRGLRPGAYRVRVEFLGYSPRTVARVVVSVAAPRAEVGRLLLQVQAVAVAGVTVEVTRPPVEMKPDRTVYDPSKIGASRGGAATDVLQTIPGVEVDPDGNVSLHGSADVKIQINGRPTPLTGDALADFLKQLPASMVKRVEVLPNPSAKYDPEGSAGAINIVLDRQADLGLSGGVSLGAGTGGRYNEAGHLAYQAGRLTAYSSYGFHDERRPNDATAWRENLFQDPVTYMDQSSAGRRDNLGHTLDLDADLRLGPRDVLSTSLMGHAFHGRGTTSVLESFLDAAQAPTSRLQERDSTGSRRSGGNAVVAFTHSFVPEKHALSAEVRYNRHADVDDRRFLQQPFATDGSAAGPAQLDLYDTREQHGETRLKLDYLRALSSRWKLQAGYEGTLSRLDYTYGTSRFTDGQPVPTDLDNAFAYRQDVHALYGVLDWQAGALGVEGGLRAEHAATRFDLHTTGATYDDGYSSLYPSGALLWKLSDEQQLRLSYSRRVRRPRPSWLNPFPYVNDPLDRFTGNPYLRPEYTNALQLEYQRHLGSGSLQVAPFYHATGGVMRTITQIDSATGIATTTFANLATGTSSGIDVSGSLHFARRLDAFLSLSGYRTTLSGGTLQPTLASDGVSWSARGSLNWTVVPGTALHWFVFYRAPQVVPQGRIAAFSMSDFSVRRQLWNDRTSIALRVADPFDTMHFSNETDLARYVQRTRRDFSARAVYLTFRWGFGQTPKLRTPVDTQAPQGEPIPGGSGNR